MKIEEINNSDVFVEFYKDITELNVLLDISGSLSEVQLENIKKFLFPYEIKIHIVTCDNEIRCYQQIDNINDLYISKKYSCNGTVLQKGIDFITKNLDTTKKLLIITDGYCEALNFDNYKGDILIITDGYSLLQNKEYSNVNEIMLE